MSRVHKEVAEWARIRYNVSESEAVAMAEMNRKFKDSVFTYLFSDPKYLRELYLYLHPEDQDVTEAECKLEPVFITSNAA